MGRLPFSILAAVIGLLAYSDSAFSQPSPRSHACGDCCYGCGKIEEAFSEARAVFIGRVIEVREIEVETGVSVSAVTFQVVESFRASVPFNSHAPNMQKVYTASLCGYRFDVGREYLVWAEYSGELEHIDDEGSVTTALSIERCKVTSRTQPLDPAVFKDDLPWLRDLPSCKKAEFKQPCRDV